MVEIVKNQTKKSLLGMRPILAALEKQIEKQSADWLSARLALMPARWSSHMKAEHGRRGGLPSADANRWLLSVTDVGRGRLSLAASDDDLRQAAKQAAGEGVDIAALAAARSAIRLEALLRQHCRRWGVGSPPQQGEPAIARMLCARWWLRQLRKTHARRCEAAAIRGGVVRRGLWPYASQDAVERRQAQRRRNRASVEGAIAESDDGEVVKLADIVDGSIANPEVKRGELMVRIRGADEYAHLQGWACEFWTVTAPSRFHAQRIAKSCGEPNPLYAGATPKDAQRYLSGVWSRARAAWARRGLMVAGVRTAEPHHDGTPHWHLVVWGPKRDLRYARRLLRVYALRDAPNEPGARLHRFTYLIAQGARGAAYAAKYISKNIDGGGMDGERDTETGRKVSSSVQRVDAWAAAWGIRQFQFFGMPPVTAWRTLRRVADAVGPEDAPIERARRAADAADWCGFWLAYQRGAMRLVWRATNKTTQYGDAAAAKVVGVEEAGRRAMMPDRVWVLHWGGKSGAQAGGSRVVCPPRSCVNNCTQSKKQRVKNDDDEAIAAVLAVA